ncbi:MAG: hypothetical protein IJN02_04085 [Bacteroidales bacterium]|nr:hypothetical protein [Bacteroidales bacterium]
MKQLSAIIILLTVISAASYGKDRAHITYGVEWGYIAFIQHGTHYNFYSPEGYRVDINNNRIKYRSNAEISFHTGYNFNTRWNLSIYIGYMGISDLHHAIPISIRATRSFCENRYGDKWFAFADLGSGFSITSRPQEILCCKLGAGYRISLSTKLKLDLKADARILYTHPELSYYNEPIPWDNVNRNNAYLSALSIGIGITF